jgi:hypothetical protein
MDILVIIAVIVFVTFSLPAMFIFFAILDLIFGDDPNNDRLLHQEDYEPKHDNR